MLTEIIQKTRYNFCVVLKSNKTIDHHRVKTFCRIDHTKLVSLMQQCKLAIVTSVDETLHLASLEAAACNLPIVTSDVGAYYNEDKGGWGMVVNRDANEYIKSIAHVLSNPRDYSPRKCLEPIFSTRAVKQKWQQVISRLT